MRHDPVQRRHSVSTVASASSRIQRFLGLIPPSLFNTDKARDLASRVAQCGLALIHLRRVAQVYGARDKG